MEVEAQEVAVLVLAQVVHVHALARVAVAKQIPSLITIMFFT